MCGNYQFLPSKHKIQFKLLASFVPQVSKGLVLGKYRNHRHYSPRSQPSVGGFFSTVVGVAALNIAPPSRYVWNVPP